MIVSRLGAQPRLETDSKLTGVKLEVDVNDDIVRLQYPAFDGLEHCFALLPTPTGPWQRRELTYSAELGAHVLFLDRSGIDLNALRSEGVAFGMDTNVGTLWLQSSGDNLKL